MSAKKKIRKARPLHPDYRKYIEEQVHLKPVTVAGQKRLLSRMPAPNKLTADWWKTRVKRVSPATSRLESLVIRQALRFLDREDQAAEIKAVKLKRREDTVTVEDLYTRKELDIILSAPLVLRDRAMLQVLYESATRANELLSMTFKNVEFFDDGTANIIIKGKTGTRSIPLSVSVPALQEWLKHHPIGKGSIWVQLRRPYKTLTTSGLYLVTRLILKAAGVTGKKKLVHMFRHTRITEFVRLGIRGQTLHKLVGWTKRSNMEAVYVHLSTADVVNEVRSKVFGLESDADRYEPYMKLLKCPRCQTTNEEHARYCAKCNMPITADALVNELEKKVDLEAKVKQLEETIQERVDESMERVVQAFTSAIQSVKSTKTLKDLALVFAKKMKEESASTDSE